VVVLTSNRSRELHDALKRRCLYHWIDYPDLERATAIVRRAVPQASEPLLSAATGFVGRTRELDLDKAPGLAEAIDWVAALCALGLTTITDAHVAPTLVALTKTADDRDTVEAALLDEAPA
jgi:MoxR-like ATPase